MNKIRFTLPLALAACMLASPAWAGEGMSFSTLNPFASKKKTKASPAALSDDPGATTIPAAGGTQATKAVPKTAAKKTPAPPSTWQKFNSGTQAFFAKSKSVLMPWSKSKPSPPPAQLTGTTKTYNGSATGSKPPAKKPFFGGIFGGSEAKPEPSTVEDFIGQPRPPF